MARLTNTFASQDANLQQEDLGTAVSRIDPEDTPLWSMMEKGRCRSLHPEWTQDALRSVEKNAHLEGDEWKFNAMTPGKRVGNYTQIFRDSGRITKSQQATMNAGNVEKKKYQMLKKGVELRKDIEYAMLLSTASKKETTTGATDYDKARKMGTIGSWLETNTDRGTGGSDGGFSEATGFTTAPVAGSKRDLDIQMMDDMLHRAYMNGANIRQMMVSPYVKEQFARLARFQGATTDAVTGAGAAERSVAPRMQSVSARGKNTIVNTADVYKGPHGTVTVMSNRVMAADADVASNAWFLDMSMVEFMWLNGRRLKQVRDLPNTGDAEQFVILGEGTLKVRNEKGLGVIADLNGLSPTL